jgi:hypothetical protein
VTQGPDPKAVNELISFDGVLNSIVWNLEKAYVSPYGHFHVVLLLVIVQLFN